jgi:hypothetical protein
MNIRRGLYRLWIAASVLWIAAFMIWYFWKQCWYGNPGPALWCWNGDGAFAEFTEFSFRNYAWLAAIGVSVPVLMLILGYVFAWVARGFQRAQ